jgi:hypothetical protein
MNPLWLILIVPGSAAIGYAVACFMWMADDSDARRIELLARHYKQLRAIIEDAWPKPKGLPELLDRHEAERKALDE